MTTGVKVGTVVITVGCEVVTGVTVVLLCRFVMTTNPPATTARITMMIMTAAINRLLFFRGASGTGGSGGTGPAGGTAGVSFPISAMAAAAAAKASAGVAGAGTGSAGGAVTDSGIAGAVTVLGTESAIRGSIEWMICSIGRPLRSPVPIGVAGAVAATWGDTAETVDTSPGAETFVPHRLQKVEPGGMRFPHLPQNEPSGSDMVSTGFGGRWLESTMIFLMGRAISIFFFAPMMLMPGFSLDRDIHYNLGRLRSCLSDISLEGFDPFVGLTPSFTGGLADKGERHFPGIRRVGQDGERYHRVTDGILACHHIPDGKKHDLLCRDDILLAVDDDE